MSIIGFLRYITNNEDVSRHEVEFDIGFFIINTVALLGGTAYLAIVGQWEWIPFLVIEYTWAIDTIRHNR